MLNKALNADLEIRSGRLKKRPEFLYVAKNGNKWVSESVIIQVNETDTGEVRFGYTATKKIGNAVIRNRTKRRLRAAVCEILKSDNLKSTDIVLIGRNTTPTVEWDKLVKDLRWCFKRLEIVKH